MMFDKLFNGSLLSFIMYQIYSTYHIGLLGKLIELSVKYLEQCLACTKYTPGVMFFKCFTSTFGRKGSAITTAQSSDAVFYTIPSVKLFEI